ncbi:Retrovirus-related Pol polyprotein from transposon TNT 1-94 [Abeliophyllum distichum]|uniref:Retrovirus-related Pol polyprotein from transposon TNT 1-94 n=1 Tax=Abeliophyllum distichum TaxID=126358 RepID=A0ABD1PPU0_9LAMI
MQNLISIGQHDDEGHDVNFCCGLWKITNGAMVVARVTKRKTLYMTINLGDTFVVAEFATNSDMWHYRFRHMSEKGMKGFLDADMAGDIDGRKSTTGYVYTLGGLRSRENPWPDLRCEENANASRNDGSETVVSERIMRQKKSWFNYDLIESSVQNRGSNRAKTIVDKEKVQWLKASRDYSFLSSDDDKFQNSVIKPCSSGG